MEENEIILEQILKKGEMQKEQTTYDYQGTMSSDDSEHKNNLPANTDEQMQYGLKIIQGAYLSKVKEYEHEIREFKNHDTEKMLIIANLEKKNLLLEKENKELKEMSERLIDDNKNLAFHLSKTKHENLELDRIKESILNTITTSTISQKEGQINEEKGLEELCHSYIQPSEFGRSGSNLPVYNLSNTTNFQSNTKSPNKNFHTLDPRTKSPSELQERKYNLNTPTKYERSNQVQNKENHDIDEASLQFSSFSNIYPRASHDKKTPRLSSNTSPGKVFEKEILEEELEIDGKKFFKQVRERLCFEDFNKFLLNIKKLNNNLHSKDQALDQANSIFGAKHKDLFFSFRNILSPKFE